MATKVSKSLTKGESTESVIDKIILFMLKDKSNAVGKQKFIEVLIPITLHLELLKF